MKFLHTADLHLDSAFCGDGVFGAEARRERQRELLKKIFRIAEDEACDMILIAGDMFDTSFVTPETRKLCLSLFEEFKKPIIIAPGNHDAYTDGSFYKSVVMPENVYIFTAPELQYFDFPELSVTVAGYGFIAPSLPSDPLGVAALTRENQGICILCAHTELDNPTSKYAPVMSSDIIRHGFDYAALGHVHSPKEYGDGDTVARYCGFPEGRSFDELGDGGVLIVSIEADGKPAINRLVTSEIKYLRAELDVDGVGDAEEIEARIDEKLISLRSDALVAVRLELSGVVPPDTLPDLARIEKKGREGFLLVEIEDSTVCIPDKSFLEKDPSLRGEFYRSLKASLYSDDPKERGLALKALKIGLAAIEGKSFSDGGRS